LQHAYDLLKKDSTPQPEEKKEFPSVNELLQESSQ